MEVLKKLPKPPNAVLSGKHTWANQNENPKDSTNGKVQDARCKMQDARCKMQDGQFQIK